MIEIQARVLQHAVATRPRPPALAQLHQIAEAVRARYCIRRQLHVARARLQPRIALFRRLRTDGHPAGGRIVIVGGQVQRQAVVVMDAERKRAADVAGGARFDRVLGQHDGADRMRVLVDVTLARCRLCRYVCELDSNVIERKREIADLESQTSMERLNT